MVFITEIVITLICLSNLKDVSNVRPKWILGNMLTWLVIKGYWSVYNFFYLTSKNNFFRLVSCLAVALR